MRRGTGIVGTGIFCFFVSTSLLEGAMVEPALQARLARANPADTFRVLLVLADRVPTAKLNYELKATTKSRAVRHQAVIEALKTKARVTQADLLTQLEREKQNGAIAAYKGYWIDNVIWVRGTKAIIERLINDPRIAEAYPELQPQLVEPVGPGEQAPLVPGGTEPGLRAIKADSAWLMGYTGRGRLVCNFDNGVLGTHRAFSTRWRGANGAPASASWFDPTRNSAFPDTFFVGTNWHGTFTMGIMCGRDPVSFDTIGVAINAQWIAAGVIDVSFTPTSYLALDAFEWAADPDGDPNTIEDVPDVVNNSWGFPRVNPFSCAVDDSSFLIGCSNVFWGAIDNLEAAGCAVVFAAGNEGGCGAGTLRNPANRASTPYNAFSVGATSPLTPFTIASFSSRGPSDCDGSIKPEVVAAGNGVRSSGWPSGPRTNTSYGVSSGTSFSTPYVAGAVALLREFNPNATVDTIKYALLNSATDLGTPGEDNAYGRGMINIKAALGLLPPNDSIHLFVKRDILTDLNGGTAEPGDTLALLLRLGNSGADTSSGTWGRLFSTDPRVTVVAGFDSAFFGTIAPKDSAANATTLLRFAFALTAPLNENLPLKLAVFTNAGPLDTLPLFFHTRDRLVRSIVTHSLANYFFTVSNFGQFGFGPGSEIERGALGQGFFYPKAGGLNNLFEMALLMGTSASTVSNAARGDFSSILIDRHFVPIAGGNLTRLTPGPQADEESFARFNDSGAPRPLGVEITQNIMSFTAANYDDFAILEYRIKNVSGGALNGLRVGLFADWDFPWGSGASDSVDFDATRNLGYMMHATIRQPRGLAVLTPPGATSYRAINNPDSIYDGFSMGEKWRFMSQGVAQVRSGGGDRAHLISTGPFNLLPGQTDTVAFAVVGGGNVSALQANTDSARSKYLAITTEVKEREVSAPLPEQFALSQNYPNPFNPNTVIRFALPKASEIELSVYNLLGQKVATLATGLRSAGVHEVVWDGTDAFGHPAASGLYFYRLKAGDFTDARKMLLLK